MKLGALVFFLMFTSAFVPVPSSAAPEVAAAPDAPAAPEARALPAATPSAKGPAAAVTVRERAPAPAPASDYRRVSDWALLLAGAAAGFVAHEAGHLAFDLAVGNDPEFRRVSLGPFPFFAIAPRKAPSDNAAYTAAMMGVLVEAAYTEAIYARNPELRYRHKPLLEGMLAFHLALDLGYAITGFANVGPNESDVNTMARAAGIPRWSVALMLAAPLAFDVLRYVRPDTRRWSMWVGLGARLPMFAVALAI